MSRQHQRIWVGIDAGKAHHWAVGLDAEGNALFSRKVVNDEQEIAALIELACGQAEQVRWAVDISSRTSTLLLALMAGRGQEVAYIPGRRLTGWPGPTAATAKPTPRTHGSSPIRCGCAATSGPSALRRSGRLSSAC